MNITLSTARLNLELVKLKDLPHIHELHSLLETDRYNTLGIPDSVEQTRMILLDWIAAAEAEPSPAYTFSIRNKETGTFIGLIALKCGNAKFRIAEVWYKLHVNHWRQGFATEALREILNFGFSGLKLHRIEAGCAIANTGSIKVLDKAGMLKEGRKRKVLPLKEGWSDNYEFAMLEEDWVGSCKSRQATKQ
ncbi:GNAT family N-acetyltransferase [Cesiribacter sp. SM1]|uniref:GNAT family N-acetyltransferase n=1 Tax=Cesiribacter sp. SM1 TaxID=2861196 RepID=UPI001CD7D5D4|nr:GNAT family protein [Cesiribacter sp. SM1]